MKFYFSLKDKKINFLESTVKKLEDENKFLKEQIQTYNVEKYKERMNELTSCYEKYSSLSKELAKCKSEYSNLLREMKATAKHMKR